MIKVLLFAACVSPLANAGPIENSIPSREPTEWCDVWISHANKNDLPRVLLIGDSITRAYHPQVEKLLEGKAYVSRLATSAFVSDPMLMAQIAMVLDGMKFDVIHFNNGMHGWQYDEEQYRRAFTGFLSTIRQHAPGAKLIWATTTPLKKSLPAQAGDPKASDERVAARNAIALEIVKPLGIPVDDLYKLTDGHPEYHSDNVHFNARGIAAQADQIAGKLKQLLKP